MYCSVADVEAELGVTLDGDQIDRATFLISAAQDFIDEFCHRTFEASTPITGERHRIEGPTLYVRVAPIASVERIRQTYGYVGEPPAAMTVGNDYDVINLTTGEIRLALYRYGEVLVDYTPAVTVPASIQDVTAQIVAQRMAGSVGSSAMPDDVKRFDVRNELVMERFALDEFPPRALQVLDTLRLKKRLVLV